jgi:hypothetical protein
MRCLAFILSLRGKIVLSLRGKIVAHQQLGNAEATQRSAIYDRTSAKTSA